MIRQVLISALKRPSIALHAADWLSQKHLLRRDPVRSCHGARIGNFIDFSEFHSVQAGVSRAELEFLGKLDLGDGAVIDVGANLGLFSLVVARHHGNRVIAFEPAPSTFAALQANVRANRLSVECRRLALADRDGEVRFSMQTKGRANYSIATGPDGIGVPARRLDTVLGELGIERVSLLKIDTEGFETAVLHGAGRTLAEIRPSLIYFEVCPALAREAGFAPSDPARILVDAGYELFELTASGALARVTPDMATQVDLANWIARAPEDPVLV